MKETRLTPTPCPRCGINLDCASCLEEDATPDADDFTVCIKCQEVLRFYVDDAGDLRIRSLSEKDIVETPLDQLARLQRIVTQVKERTDRRAKLKSKARAKRKRARKTRSR